MFEAVFEEQDRTFTAEFSEGISGGGARVNYGAGLKLDPDTMTLSVDVAEGIEEGDMRPISSDAIWQELSAIETMLKEI